MFLNYNQYRNPFRSFWWAGFECADHVNAFGNRVDMIDLTGHNKRLREDFLNVKSLGIATVREGIRWSRVERKAFTYEWTEVEEVIRTSQEINLQIIWDICHFGFPDDLTPLHPMFARRFAHLCKAFVEFYRGIVPNGELIVTPINEVSFLSWLGGDARGTSPYCVNLGWEVKYALMRAYIEGIEGMKEVDPTVKILTTEPLVNIVPKDPADARCAAQAHERHEEQYQVLEILTGKMCPELRGKPEYLDMVGVNFYYHNQWTNEEHEFLPWGDTPPHPKWKPLSFLLQEVFLKYGRPIVITETSHPGADRLPWLRMVAGQCEAVRSIGLPLYGCCIYPVIDRPDWDFPGNEWHHSGLWDIHNPATQERIPMEDLLEFVKEQIQKNTWK